MSFLKITAVSEIPRNKLHKVFMFCVATYLLMLLHSGIQFLGEVIGYIRHSRFFLVGSTDAALVFVSFLIILLFGILAVCMGSLKNRQTQICRLKVASEIMLQSQLPIPTF